MVSIPEREVEPALHYMANGNEGLYSSLGGTAGVRHGEPVAEDSGREPEDRSISRSRWCPPGGTAPRLRGEAAAASPRHEEDEAAVVDQLDRIEKKLDQVLEFRDELQTLIKVFSSGHGLKILGALVRSK